jgi:hydroxymethylpyrimidine/phosphomethylpyrimidine kinase
MKKVLTIAGSDCSGGAGIQADIKTITMHGKYAMSVITSLTAQNTTGVSGIHDVPAEFVGKQLDAVFTDIFPDAVKTGMVSNAEIIETIAERLKYYNARNIVVDPVMVSTSGRPLIEPNAADSLCRCLFPLAYLITPNIPETETLTGMKISCLDDMKSAGNFLSEKYGTAVLLKGGHLVEKAADVLCCPDGSVSVFETERVNNPNTHGTGCTLSSAIASSLADGFTLNQSVEQAKTYITGAIKSGLDIGKGNGPLNHFYNLNR